MSVRKILEFACEGGFVSLKNDVIERIPAIKASERQRIDQRWLPIEQNFVQILLPFDFIYLFKLFFEGIYLFKL